jgi:hypothetical protein
VFLWRCFTQVLHAHNRSSGSQVIKGCLSVSNSCACSASRTAHTCGNVAWYWWVAQRLFPGGLTTYRCGLLSGDSPLLKLHPRHLALCREITAEAFDELYGCAVSCMSKGVSGSRNCNTRHLDHVTIRQLDNVNIIQGTWITWLLGTWITWLIQDTWITWQQNMTLGTRDYNTRHLDYVTAKHGTWSTWL